MWRHEVPRPDDDVIQVEHVEFPNPEARERYVLGLCQKIDSALEKRKDLEEQWKLYLKQYNARLERDDAKDTRDSQLDFPVTKERAIGARARHINPIFSHSTVFTAFEQNPIGKDYRQAFQDLLEVTTPRPKWRKMADQAVLQAQIFPKAVAKITFGFRSRRIKRYQEGEEIYVDKAGNPITDEAEAATVNLGLDEVKATRKSRKIVDDDVIDDVGCDLRVLRTPDFIHPPGISNVYETWVCERYRPTMDQVAADERQKVWREDLREVFGEKLEKLGQSGETEEEKQDDFLWVTREVADSEMKPSDDKTQDLCLYEVYDRINGREVIVTIDRASKKDLRIVYNWNFDMARPYVTMSWDEALGDIDGTSLCKDLYPTHKAYSASVNQRLDAGTKSNEKILIGVEGCGLGDYFQNGRLDTGYYEVKDHELLEAIRDISVTANFTPLEQLEHLILSHADNISGEPPPMRGMEVANRPTASGTTAVIEEAKQPSFSRVETLREFMAAAKEIELCRLYQHFPDGIELYLAGESPESQALINTLFQWPPSYWRKLFRIEVSVSSQRMSKSLRKQEVLGAIDKLPEIIDRLMQLADAATQPAPISLVAEKLFQVYAGLAVRFFEEFELEDTELREIFGTVDAAKQMGEYIASLQAQFEQLVAQMDQAMGQPGGGPPGSPVAGPSMGPGQGGPPPSPAGMGGAGVPGPGQGV